MNFSSRKKLLPLAWIAACCALAIAWVNHNLEVKKMEERIRLMSMKTVCVGRFLLDVPEKSVVSYRNASLSGWDISSWVESDEKFFGRLTSLEAKLKMEKNAKDGVSLERIDEIKNDDVQGRIFVFNRNWLDGYDGSKKKVNQVISIRALVRSRDVTYKVDAEVRWDADVEKLEKILKQLRWRAEYEIPEQEGFCFSRGMLVDPLPAHLAEYTGIFLGIKEHPDLAIAFTTMAGINPGKTLLQRDAENDVKLEYRNRFHVLREGARGLNGIPGEEMLERVDEPNGSTLQGFMWESLSKQDDVYLPSLILELDTGHGQPGKPINSSLSDVEALALWDKISSSLRRRPVGASRPTASSSKEG
ncbi:T6SS immunity protein Tli4 family protein [Duganella sp. Dugasp56]|uniref:T6SS immunity protein Tli4 family protein n=1 Tax=Duganella sp. Dugasp56 TaxID=3243046 RepID=UPI0039AEFFEE